MNREFLAKVLDDCDGVDGTDSTDGVVPELVCEGETLAVGCPCETADDCISGFCIATEGGQRCVETCVDTCPNGFACIGMGGTDQVFLCLPQFAKLCQPCKQHLDCQAKGDVKLALCLDYGDLGSFCGGYCDSDSTCHLPI